MLCLILFPFASILYLLVISALYIFWIKCNSILWLLLVHPENDDFLSRYKAPVTNVILLYKQVDKLKVLSESLASSSSKAENRISDHRCNHFGTICFMLLFLSIKSCCYIVFFLCVGNMCVLLIYFLLFKNTIVKCSLKEKNSWKMLSYQLIKH